MTTVAQLPLTEVDARRAIYIDFEGLGNEGAEPALLGVLVADTASDEFIQYLWDPLLTSARVASKAVRAVASIDAAIEVVVSSSEREQRRIVSWSSHERMMVHRCCTAALAARFDAVWLNALEVVRPWKRALYPTFAFELEPFGGRHPLKEYFRMTGYVLPKALRPPAPARWLKHGLEQMAKTSGRYRQVTATTKRDWHKLLLYNEHDCRGMYAVVAQATRERALWNAYANTHFLVFDGARDVPIRVGQKNPALDAVLAKRYATRWALVTASNPDSVALSPEENLRRNLQLIAGLESKGYAPLPAEGRDPSGAWPAEASVFVPHLTKKDARTLGRAFGQLAIVKGHAGMPAVLVACGLAADRGRADAGAFTGK